MEPEFSVVFESDRFRFVDANRQLLTQFEVFSQLSTDETLARVLISTLADSGHQSYFWECSPIESLATAYFTPFEFALLPAPMLDEVQPDPKPFEGKFTSSDRIAVFNNLRGDATLVSPNPKHLTLPTFGTHLATYIRNVPRSKSIEFFKRLGNAVMSKLMCSPDKAIWVSTSGLGVFWLHVRLDDEPKYYHVEGYKTIF